MSLFDNRRTTYAFLSVLAIMGCSKKDEAKPTPTPPATIAPANATKPTETNPTVEPELLDGDTGDRKALLALPIGDGIGYMSGNYGTSHNHPAMYADTERKVFVLMGRKGKGEVPFAKVDDALAAYEQFLLQHGYAANGKPAPDEHQKIMVDGKEMVVMTMSELMPEMSTETKAKYTDRQYKVLRNTTGTDGYKQFSGNVTEFPPHPLMFAGAEQVFVVGPDTDKQFPIAQATEAFKEYREMLKRTKIVP